MKWRMQIIHFIWTEKTGCIYSEHLLNGTFLEYYIRGSSNFPNFHEHSSDICIKPQGQRHQRQFRNDNIWTNFQTESHETIHFISYASFAVILMKQLMLSFSSSKYQQFYQKFIGRINFVKKSYETIIVKCYFLFRKLMWRFWHWTDTNWHRFIK